MLVIVAVGLAGCLLSGAPSLPDRILDPEVIGVVVEDRNLPDSPRHIYVMHDGTEVDWGDEATELTGPGPGEGRMLIVARDDDETYYLSLVAADRMAIEADCYRLSGTTAWETMDGIVFEFPPADVGIRLPAAPEYDPRTDEETSFIRSEQSFCITPDGVVHAPN